MLYQIIDSLPRQQNRIRTFEQINTLHLVIPDAGPLLETPN